MIPPGWIGEHAETSTMANQNIPSQAMPSKALEAWPWRNCLWIIDYNPPDPRRGRPRRSVGPALLRRGSSRRFG